MAALLMTALMLSIPFMSAAFAAGIARVTVTGDNGIDGYFSEYDNTHYTVEASFDDPAQEVTLSNIRVNQEHVLGEFCTTDASCALEDGSDDSYACMCTYDWSPDQPFTMSFRLHNDEGNPVGSSVSKTLIPDTTDPVFTDFGYEQQGGTVTISYQVEDSATGNAQDGCSGIAGVELWASNDLLHAESVDTSECLHEGSFTTELPEGDTELYAIALDRVDNAATSETVTISVDTVPPVIRPVFRLLQNGNELDWISTAGPNAVLENVEVEVIIEDANLLDEEQVTAELSQLFPFGSNQAVPVTEILDNEQPVKRAVWFLQRVSLGQPQATITVTAYDAEGNSATQDVSQEFTVDNTGPALESFCTGFQDGDTCYIHDGSNQLTVTFVEEGIGMGSGFVFVNLNTLGYSNHVRVHACDEENGLWTCTGSIRLQGSQDRNGQSLYVSVTDRTTDDLGNPVQDSEERQAYFVVDTEEPVVTYVEVNSTVTGSGEVLIPGDPVEIQAFITETISGIREENVLADFSAFAEAEDWQEADSCTAATGPHSYRCTWQYAGIMQPGERRLAVHVTDNAGNTATGESERFRILGITEGAVQDNWKEDADVDDVPELNPNFLWYNSQGTYQAVAVELEKKPGAEAFVHGFRLTECTGSVVPIDEADEEEYPLFSEEYAASITNSFYDAPPSVSRARQIFVFSLPGSTSYEEALRKGADRIAVDCTIEILQSSSRFQNIYEPYEEATAHIDIPFMKGPDIVFTMPERLMLDKIRKYRGEIASLNDWIGTLDGIINTLSPMCNTFQAVRQVLATTTASISLLAEIPPFKPALKPAAILAFNLLDFIETKAWYGNILWGKVKLPGWLSPYGPLSVGFMCQTVLCNECTGLSNYAFGAAGLGRIFPEGNQSYFGSGGEVPAEGSSAIFRRSEAAISTGDIHNNLLLAASCFPPCLPGIANTLYKWKRIRIYHNVCLMRAEGFGNEDIGLTDCGDFVSSMACMEIAGQGWEFLAGRWIRALMQGWITRLRDLVMTKLDIFGMTELELDAACELAKNDASFVIVTQCVIRMTVDAVGMVVLWQDAIDAFSRISEQHERQSDEEIEAEAHRILDEGAAAGEFGGGPGYG